MTTYKFDVTLVSGLWDFDLDLTYGSDPYEAFDNYFFNDSGTGSPDESCPCLKPGVDALPKDSSLVGLLWDSEMEQFEGSTPYYEIQSVAQAGDQNSGWNYTFSFLITFSAQTSADSLEEAINKFRNEALASLAIYDGGANEVLEVEDVRLVHAHL
jgi:hypothetical protein